MIRGAFGKLWQTPSCQYCRSVASAGIPRRGYAVSLGKPMGNRSHQGEKKVQKTNWTTQWERSEPQVREERNMKGKRSVPSRSDHERDNRSSTSRQRSNRPHSARRPTANNRQRSGEAPQQQQQQQQQQQPRQAEHQKKHHKHDKKKETLSEADSRLKDVYIPEAISVSNLAVVLGVRLDRIVRTMNELDMGNTSHDRMLNADESSLVAMQLDMNPIVDARQSLDLFPQPRAIDPNAYQSRPPVVTIMGHVDHGKTTLLDTLRKTSVAAGEAGGITQHIGAFSVTLPSKKTITFLDTPGHAAFSAMRARGAKVTDIVVIVVAADDGIMPQTQEAIQHAQNAGVPIVVAINKCDKPGVDPSRVIQGLARYNVHLEEIGGDVPCVEISGLTGHNLDQLEETIVTLAEVLELKAEQQIGAEGVVLESQIEKGKGNVATILVQRGVLRPGAVIVAGQTWCKVRSMTDQQGKIIKEALPSTPVKVIGWKGVPNAGDELLQASDEATAKTVVENRSVRYQREQQLKDLEVINEKRRQHREQMEKERAVQEQYKQELYLFQRGVTDSAPEPLSKRLSMLQSLSSVTAAGEDPKLEMLELRTVIKGDVSGTVEAIVDCLGGLQTNKIRVKVVGRGVGNITESDVQLAATCGGRVIGFNVRADKKIMAEAQRSGVALQSYSIIYKLLEDVKETMSDMLPPIITTQVVGEAQVVELFEIGVKGRETRLIAGCRVTNGAIQRNNRIRIMRDKQLVWEGHLETLRQVKKDINEAKKGLECGMSFEGFGDFQPGDTIQCVETIETKQRL